MTGYAIFDAATRIGKGLKHVKPTLWNRHRRRSVRLVTHPYLVQKLRICDALTPLFSVHLHGIVLN